MPMGLFASFLDKVTSPEIVVYEFISIFLDAFYAMHVEIAHARQSLSKLNSALAYSQF